MKILIIEDDEVFRRTLIRTLERLGHTTCWAANGEGGLALMRSETPDVVLLDLMLKEGISGWEVARVKLLDRTVREIPTIIITGLEPDQARNPLVGVLQILSKPVDVPTLERALAYVQSLKANGAS